MINKRAVFSPKFWEPLGYTAPPPIFSSSSPSLPCQCWQWTWLSYILKHNDSWVLISTEVSTGLCRRKMMSNQTLKLEEGRCVPPVLILTVVFTDWGQSCAVWLSAGGWPVAQCERTLEALKCCRSSWAPSAPLRRLSARRCWGAGGEVVRPATRRAFHWMKQGALAFLHSCAFLEPVLQCGA